MTELKICREKKWVSKANVCVCVCVCVYVCLAIKGLVMWAVSKVWVDMSGSHSEGHFDGNHKNKELPSVEE